MKEKFQIEFLEEASTFLDTLDEKARNKVLYNMRSAQLNANKALFKKLTDDIWEFRTLYNRTYYRLFAFWDKSSKTVTVVVATHGLVKKTDKTPPADLAKAERLRKQYLAQKTN